jgi:hypothetical protein
MPRIKNIFLPRTKTTGWRKGSESPSESAFLFPVGSFENILGTLEIEDVTKNKGCKMKHALIKKNVGKFPYTFV